MGVIATFACKQTERLFHDTPPIKRLPRNLWDAMRRKLQVLHYARSLDDLRALPGNRLEVLKGDRAGQYSIRVNRQWRICFVWTPGDYGADAQAVEIVDYH